MNPVVYDWVDGERRRKPIEVARELLAEAGYPGGTDEETGRPLLLNLDTPASGPEFKSQMDWMRQQFDKLGIQLVVRATTWSRFQQKTADGNVQMFFGSGWMGDYPDQGTVAARPQQRGREQRPVHRPVQERHLRPAV